MLSFIVGLAVLALAQDNPLNIPMPSAEEIANCVPPEARQAASIEELTREQRLAIVACAQRLAARQFQSRLPIVIDPRVSIVEVSAQGPEMHYVYRIDVDGSRITPAIRSEMERMTREAACANRDMLRTMENGGSYSYRWNDRAGAAIHQMRVAACR